MTARISTKRLLNSFTTAAEAQAESMRSLAIEADRYARDSALIALAELRQLAIDKQGQLANEDVAAVMGKVFGNEFESWRVGYLTNQARKRQDNRVKHVDPFTTVAQTLKQLRGKANNASQD